MTLSAVSNTAIDISNIPGNCKGQKISIPYHRWYLGILREKGVSWAGILTAWGVTWNSKCMGGFSSDFQEGKDGESFT